MSDNPTATANRPRTSIKFCLATTQIAGEPAICTRAEHDSGHCCDEIRRVAWNGRRTIFVCKEQDYDHSTEKGLSR